MIPPSLNQTQCFRSALWETSLDPNGGSGSGFERKKGRKNRYPNEGWTGKEKVSFFKYKTFCCHPLISRVLPYNFLKICWKSCKKIFCLLVYPLDPNLHNKVCRSATPVLRINPDPDPDPDPDPGKFFSPTKKFAWNWREKKCSPQNHKKIKLRLNPYPSPLS